VKSPDALKHLPTAEKRRTLSTVLAVEQPRLSPSRAGGRLVIPIVLPHVILDVHEITGEMRTGLFVANNPINYYDPLGLWGIQFGNFNIGYGNPNLAFDSSSWNDLQQGASATADGLLTAVTANGLFGTFNPNVFRDNYDPCDSTLQWSHGLGEFAGTLLTIYAGGPQGSLFGDTQTVTHFGSDTLQAGDWVMTGPPSLRNWVMSGMNNAPWNYVTTTVSRSALSPAANEAGTIISTVKTAIGQRIYTP